MAAFGNFFAKKAEFLRVLKNAAPSRYFWALALNLKVVFENS